MSLRRSCMSSCVRLFLTLALQSSINSPRHSSVRFSANPRCAFLWLGINSPPFPILLQCSALGNDFVPHAHTPRGFSFPFCGFFHLCYGILPLLSNFLPILSILRARYPQKSFESIRGGNSIRASPRISPAGYTPRSLRKMRVARKLSRNFRRFSRSRDRIIQSPEYYSLPE